MSHEPVTGLLDLDRLEDARSHALGHLAASLQVLSGQRWRAMTCPPESVRDKPLVAPSGDPLDFVSVPTYCWPNPATRDGLPWVFRDGEVNPANLEFDSRKVFRLVDNLEVLALLAWYFDDAPATVRAVELLRAWFLDPDSRMNPHLTYAQFEPGNLRGHSYGIICFQRGYLLVALIELLQRCGDAITRDDRSGLEAWFASLLGWLLGSEMGSEERGRPNNHGTWYDVQVVAYQLFLGRRREGRRWLETYTLPRMSRQIAADGAQILELKRVAKLQYCVFNLFGLCVLAELGRDVGLNMWAYQGTDGGSIQSAVDWLLPYLVGEKTLEGPITKRHGTFSVSAEAAMILRLAADRFSDARYVVALERLAYKVNGCRSALVLPPYVGQGQARRARRALGHKDPSITAST